MKHFKLGLVLIMLAVAGGALQGAIPTSQRQALIDLYNATGGDSWTTKTGWKDGTLAPDGFAQPGTENGWYGVSLGALNTTVSAINLSSNNLVGALPSAIGDFPNLTALNLHTNQLSGSLPSSLGSLTNLTLLHLYQNDFTGSLPTELGNLTNLLQIDFYGNQFSGTIPVSLGNLSNLQSLMLNANQLSGSIPQEFGNLDSLQLLNCFDNDLSGTIPASLGGMASLRVLLLHNNQFTGNIPPELGGLSTLQVLYLSGNQLDGSIPASLGNLSSLEDIEIGNNLLTGNIPPELGGLTNLVNLHLQFNQLSGPIPASIGNLTKLVSITLQFNLLSGSIPAELGDLTALESLYVHSNHLSGTIPPQLGDLANLHSLYLNSNLLSGSIPAALGNLSNLLFLRLDDNQLSGSIPAELGNLTSLTDLFLGDNQLSGPLPASLGSLTNLEYLYLKSNMLGGAVPAAITNLTALSTTATDIGYNALYTSDPTVLAFLNSKDPEWALTQTIAPSEVTATALDGANILVSWIPITYHWDGGYYTLFSSDTAGGPYASVGQTVNKGGSSLQVNGLTPGQMYYFVVRTHTDVHAGNQNPIDSEYSTEASAVAWTQVNVRVMGTVLAGTSPLANVLMSGLPGSPVTNSSGVYDVSMGAGWSGTVTPSLAGYTFVPSSRTYTGLTADQLGQDYAATFVPPTITVTAPNGGESWIAGSTHNVTWTQTGLTGDVTIDLYKGGVYAKTLGTSAAMAGTYTWEIASGETVGTDYRTLIWQGGTSDESNANFAIASAAIRKDDLLATWDGQGVYYKNSDTGAWVRMASPATMISCGDFDGDGTDDLAGLWPSQGGIWVRYSSTGAWARLSSTARYIAAGDMNGDGRVDLLGTWDGQGVYYRNSMTGAWVRMASEATMIACGDLDGDSIDDLIGLWPTQGGIWVKYSHNNAWAQISSTARHISAGDMNGDGRDDLLGTWDGQGAYYRNSITGAWVRMASPATLITTGDVDGDSADDLIGIWPTQGGVWVKYSQNGAWALMGSTARDISAGKMRPASVPAPPQSVEELPLPMGGSEPGPEGAIKKMDYSSRGPGGGRFVYLEEKNQTPMGKRVQTLAGESSVAPGEAGFVADDQPNLFPGEKAGEKKAEKGGKKEKK